MRVIIASCNPVFDGVKVTRTSVLCPAPRTIYVGQTVKSLRLLVILLTIRVPDPVLVTVKISEPEPPSTVLAMARELADSEIPGELIEKAE